MNDNFMTVTVDDKDYIIKKHLESESEKGYTYRFSTEINGEEHVLQAKWDTLRESFWNDITVEMKNSVDEELDRVLREEFIANLRSILRGDKA